MNTSIGRNDPCRCGSGKKYKKCCLEKDELAKIQDLGVESSAAPQAPAVPPSQNKPKPAWQQNVKGGRGFRPPPPPRRGTGG